MLIVHYKKLLFKIKHVWFLEDDGIDKIVDMDKNSDLIYFHGIDKPLTFNKSVVNKQYTIIKNLNYSLEDMDEIISKS
jgi:hypothetical protein